MRESEQRERERERESARARASEQASLGFKIQGKFLFISGAFPSERRMRSATRYILTCIHAYMHTCMHAGGQAASESDGR